MKKQDLFFLLTSKFMPAVGEAMGDLLGGEPVVLLHPAVLHRSVMLTCLYKKASLPWIAAENQKDISMQPFRLAFF